MDDGVFPENKTLARTVARVFGGSPRVTRFWDDNHKSWVDILACSDHRPGVTAFSTLGLSDHPLYKDGAEYPARLEIVGACVSKFAAACTRRHQGFDNAISTAAFCIINSRWFCYPGAIFPDVVAMYKLSKTMKHLLFVPPFLWEDDLKTLDLGKKKVSFLLAAPISEAEYVFAQQKGSDLLEEVFERTNIDIFDLNRKSVF